ncbi:MAG: hypothetical protein PWQ77_962 [Kosmotogales bacterium]|nr:hypothetical protein [Kosmotogales bacterium]
MNEKQDDMNNEELEHNHEHNESDMFDMFSITNDDGEEKNFAIISEFENEGISFWVCQEAFGSEENGYEFDDENFTLFKVMYDENGEPTLEPPSDEEYEKASEKWDELSEEYLEEDEEEE